MPLCPHHPKRSNMPEPKDPLDFNITLTTHMYLRLYRNIKFKIFLSSRRSFRHALAMMAQSLWPFHTHCAYLESIVKFALSTENPKHREISKPFHLWIFGPAISITPHIINRIFAFGGKWYLDEVHFELSLINSCPRHSIDKWVLIRIFCSIHDVYCHADQLLNQSTPIDPAMGSPASPLLNHHNWTGLTRVHFVVSSKLDSETEGFNKDQRK